MRLAASRATWTAGNSNAINTPIIAITTRSSTNVKAKMVVFFHSILLMKKIVIIQWNFHILTKKE
jgi:hypothetical protein